MQEKTILEHTDGKCHLSMLAFPLEIPNLNFHMQEKKILEHTDGKCHLSMLAFPLEIPNLKPEASRMCLMFLLYSIYRVWIFSGAFRNMI